MKITTGPGYVTFAHAEGSFSITFHRTIRLPEDGKTHALPPSLGTLPVHLVDDFKDHVPASWVEHGGVFLPLHEREAMWLGFGGGPCAVKVAAGKVNAINGKPWSESLVAGIEDYLVTPPQPWLDGFNSGDGFIRQFVAMAMGKGYTVEAQVTGKEQHGGLQLMVIPPKPGAIKQVPECRGGLIMPSSFGGGSYGSQTLGATYAVNEASVMSCSLGQEKSVGSPILRSRKLVKADEMGLGAGGRMHQKIYPDPHGIEVWDQAAAGRVFIHLVSAEAYEHITGLKAPALPPAAQSYIGPWFGVQDGNLGDIAAPDELKKVKTIGEKDNEHGFEGQQDDSPIHETITTSYPIWSPPVAVVRNGKW